MSVSNGASDASTGLQQQWLALHLPQLQHYNVPERLYSEVFKCVHHTGEPSLDFAEMATRDNAAPGCRQRVVAARALVPEQVVRRVDHIWEFGSAVDAQKQLLADEAKRAAMVELVKAAYGDDGASQSHNGERPLSTEQQVELVMKHLHLLAFSIRFGEKSSDMSYYVLNHAGSSLQEAKRFNVQVAPIFCMLQQKLFSIVWPVAHVNQGDELIRPYAAKISMMALSKKSYWEARYEGEEEYDWYCQYAHVRSTLASYLTKSAKVLVAGSGTSRLPIDMFLDGYTDVHAMDFAANVVRKMQERCARNAWGVSFVEADMTNMIGWESSSVDCIIDKGCLDTMLLKPETDAIDNNWKLVAPDSPDDIEDARNGMLEAARVLKPGGYFVLMTFGSPTNRIHMFDWIDHRDKSQAPMEWDVLQCLEMEPGRRIEGFGSRFYLFIAQKKLQ